MTVVLRAATEGDSAGIADVLIASRRAFLADAPMAHPESDVRRWVRDTLVPSGCVTVAAEQGAVVGFIAVHHDAPDAVGWIEQLYLAPSHVGRGIGARLLEQALAGLPATVRLCTFQTNAGARAFYERHGFRAIAFGDGRGNEERCPDVLYERR